MRLWIRRACLVLLFVLVNIAIAAPVYAGLDNDVCVDEGGGFVPCCTGCIFFCNCTLAR